MATGNIQTVTIAGVGLIGGSFALALRRAGYAGRILGVSSQRTIEEAISLGVIDEGVSLAEGARRGDLVYLAQPILKIIDQLPEVARNLRSGSLVTDAGSTKVRIGEAAGACLPPEAFIGGHPMAGKESRGVTSAEAGLFDGRTYVLTPTMAPDRFTPVAAEFESYLRQMGANVLYTSAAIHDQVVAVTSHLAQLASSAIGFTVLREVTDPSMLAIAGPGLFDMTRLAMSSYDVWHDIIATNKGPIEAVLDRYIKALQEMKENLGTAETERAFRDGCATAKRLRGIL